MSIKESEKILDDLKKNLNSVETDDTGNKAIINNKSKNAYKWIMEEFEDKNLDKVKRTLLVALDDISKGTSKSLKSELLYSSFCGLMIYA